MSPSGNDTDIVIVNGFDFESGLVTGQPERGVRGENQFRSGKVRHNKATERMASVNKGDNGRTFAVRLSSGDKMERLGL